MKPPPITTTIIDQQQHWSSLLPELRQEVLQYLDERDIAEYACVSRFCRLDTQDDSLPQQRTAVIACQAAASLNCFHYGLHPLAGALLKVPAHSSVFQQRFTSFKLEDPSCLTKINNREAKPISKSVTLSHVTRLDMSSMAHNNERFPQVAPSIAKLMTQVVPNIEALDLSHNQVGTATLADAARNCKHLTTIRIVGGMLASSVTGIDLKQCETLKELYLGNTAIATSTKEESDIFLNADDEEACPLSYCLWNLERISLKGCCYYSMSAKHDKKPFTQTGLIKLVRCADKLRWFDSDLTAENVKMLQAERPDVVFCGYEEA